MKISIYLSKKKKNTTKKAPVYFRLTHKHKRTELSTGIYVEERYFSKSKKEITRSHPLADSYNRQIIQTHAKLLDIAYNLKTVDVFDTKIVKDIFLGEKKIDVTNITRTLPPLTEWCHKYVELKYRKKYNTKKIYTDAINYLQKLEHQNKFTIHAIDKKMAEMIYNFFILNQRFHYLAKIKFLLKEFNEHFDQENHFRKYRVPSTKKYTKNALTRDNIKKIADYTPTNHRSKIFHDLFLFQYYSAGSRFGDALKLKWEDVSEDYIKRIEEKTEKERHIPINNSTRSILNKYRGNTSEYVFDLAQPTKQVTNEEWCKYKSAILASMNSYLKTLQQNLDIKTHISSHTSRHSFATISFETTKDIKSTSMMIGHSRLATTEMYVHTNEKLSKQIFDDVYDL